MTNKDNFLRSLHHARIEHTKWVSKMRLLSTGTFDSETKAQNSFFETNFAQWFHEKASYLIFDKDCSSLKEIESLIQHIDTEYILLYNISIKNRSKTFLGKVKPFTSQEESSSEKYYNAIKIITVKLEKLLEDASSELLNISEDKFSFMEFNKEKSDMIHNTPNKSKISHSGARGAYQE